MNSNLIVMGKGTLHTEHTLYLPDCMVSRAGRSQSDIYHRYLDHLQVRWYLREITYGVELD